MALSGIDFDMSAFAVAIVITAFALIIIYIVQNRVGLYGPYTRHDARIMHNDRSLKTRIKDEGENAPLIDEAVDTWSRHMKKFDVTGVDTKADIPFVMTPVTAKINDKEINAVKIFNPNYECIIGKESNSGFITGSGSKSERNYLMREIANYTDKTKKPISLIINDKRENPQHYYEQWGFKVNKAGNDLILTRKPLRFGVHGNLHAAKWGAIASGITLGITGTPAIPIDMVLFAKWYETKQRQKKFDIPKLYKEKFDDN
jgi:hypothetical protein